MSEEFINKVTLEYLINKEYNVAIKPDSKIDKKDKKFYRKRVFNLTKQLLSNETPPELFPEVKYAFDNYVNHCISYFKTMDSNDILQEDYKNISNDDYASDTNSTQEEADKLMMRSIPLKATTLDSFITRTVKKDTTIIPQQKEVDLSNPVLKLKGIKKKNITNVYEENKETNQDKKK